MPDRFEDERGVIQDLLVARLDAVTEIVTLKGAVRGNHIHERTTQWTYIVNGRMHMVARYPDGFINELEYGPGDLICDQPGVAHAWRALKDTHVLVFTRGPRSGASYEDDVQRLTPEDRLIQP
jgi:uncharacterized RmlC-like cupin family protein